MLHYLNVKPAACLAPDNIQVACKISISLQRSADSFQIRYLFHDAIFFAMCNMEVSCRIENGSLLVVGIMLKRVVIYNFVHVSPLETNSHRLDE